MSSVIGKANLLSILPNDYKDKIEALYSNNGKTKKIIAKSSVIKELDLNKELAEKVENHANDLFKKYSNLLNRKRDEKFKILNQLEKLELEISELADKTKVALNEMD